MDFRPHIMIWTPVTSTTEPGTGYEIPCAPGIQQAVLCRFHLGGNKVLRNEDSTEVQQKGQIRVDIGSPMPDIWQRVTIKDAESNHIHYDGQILDKYQGQLTWRLDV